MVRIVERGEWGISAAEEYGSEKLNGISPLSLGGGQQPKIRCHSLCSEEGSTAEGDLAKDDGKAEGLLGMIVGRRHAVDS